jgi:hypothetical protein
MESERKNRLGRRGMSTSILCTDCSELTNLFFLSSRAATMESAKFLTQVSILGRSGA